MAGEWTIRDWYVPVEYVYFSRWAVEILVEAEV